MRKLFSLLFLLSPFVASAQSSQAPGHRFVQPMEYNYASPSLPYKIGNPPHIATAKLPQPDTLHVLVMSLDSNLTKYALLLHDSLFASGRDVVLSEDKGARFGGFEKRLSNVVTDMNHEGHVPYVLVAVQGLRNNNMVLHLRLENAATKKWYWYKDIALGNKPGQVDLVAQSMDALRNARLVN